MFTSEVVLQGVEVFFCYWVTVQPFCPRVYRTSCATSQTTQTFACVPACLCLYLAVRPLCLCNVEARGHVGARASFQFRYVMS